jgi:tetratricopeptide (TPR) repeat protein
MRAFVFTDKALESEVGRFVWLEIDTERPENAALKKKLAVVALPTYFIVDPTDERVLLRWVGGATVAQLQQMFGDAVAMRTSGETGPDAKMERAERLYGEGKSAEAAAAYREALNAAPAGWPRYGRATESLLFALTDSEQFAEAARVARDALPRLRSTSSAANVAGSGLSAALGMSEKDSSRRELIEFFEKATREVLSDPTIKMAGDDRSGAYIALLDARQAAGDSAGAKRVAWEWATMLESEAARARTADERAVFDSHRLSAYIELGQADKAIPMLLASEKALPNDYNPPARLAVAYKELGRYDEALAAADRALAKAYGPRKLRIYQTRADILAAKGDSAGAKQTLEEALATAQAFPDGQRSQSAIDALKKKIEKLQ